MEEWREIPGYRGAYEVSSCGQVRRMTTYAGRTRQVPRLLKPHSKKDSYPHVLLHLEGKGRNHYVHRLVALAFLGPGPDGYQVNHKDGNKQNSLLANLEYITVSANTLHAYHVLGVGHLVGTERWNAKLTDEKVRQIRARWRVGDISNRQIAAQYGVSEQTIGRIVNGFAWQHVR